MCRGNRTHEVTMNAESWRRKEVLFCSGSVLVLFWSRSQGENQTLILRSRVQDHLLVFAGVADEARL